MVFSSHLFLFWFLPAALLAYGLAPRRLRHLSLTLSSYLFYGWANPAFVLLMLFSTAVDYLCGLWIAHGGRLRLRRPEVPLDPALPRNARQRLGLWLSVATNLGLLGFFKYFEFGVESVSATVAWMTGSAVDWGPALRITLPLGISFYTFQSMSYTIDVYRGDARALADPVDFACYVSMFPQLVAGPIVRFHEVASQLESRRHTMAKAARGVALFALGMGKKVLLANPCGQLADAAFDAGGLTAIDAWLGAFAYGFQIYFDFAGYSDMAVGLGLLFGFELPRNFDDPYRATSVADFWRRWHQSLSRWLRDYLYLTLGGNRRGRRRTYANLATVMLLGGLWHGAAWTFVLWGAYHGALLIGERWQRERWPQARLDRRVAAVGTFVLVTLGWVLFRARDLPQALAFFGAMFGALEPPPAAALVSASLRSPVALGTLALAALATWSMPQAWRWSERITWARAAVCGAVLLAALVGVELQGYNPFLYFIF